MDPNAEPLATETQDGSTPSAEPTEPVDKIAEAVDAAFLQVRGEGGALEAAAPGADEPAKADEGKGDEEKKETPASEPSFYSKAELDEMKPGALIHLDMNRVPVELRGMVGAVRKALAQGFQEIADAKKSKQPDPTESGQPKALSKEELYDMAMDGPEGFDKAMRAWAEQNMPGLLRKSGVDPDITSKQAEKEYLADAIDLASETFEDLSQPEFKAAVGAELKANPNLATRLRKALAESNVEAASDIIEKAAALATKRLASETVKTRQKTDAEAQKQKEKDDKATRAAKENSASVASKVNTKGPGPRPAKMTSDQAVDAAFAAVRSGAR
jgi:hypothetical protein